jgi:hypothetical protein
MNYQKYKLIQITRKVTKTLPLTPQEITYILDFEKTDKTPKPVQFLRQLALPLSLAFGFLFTAFPHQFQQFTTHLPAWTNFPPPILTGVDYLWDLIGEPVHKPNIIYHIPNIILYSFGIFGLKKLMDAIDRRTWLDKVRTAKETLKQQIQNGTLTLQMKKGHSLLFVGQGDFIAMQFTLNHDSDDTVTIAQKKPTYTNVWNHYNNETLYEDLKTVILRASGHNAGEYVFFPVKDDQIFLPGEKAYDLSPHKLDILCQNIRVLEKELKWHQKRIIIIGDKFHKSFVQSEDQQQVIEKSEDIISLSSIAQKYPNVTLLDPSDIVLKKIITIAKGRKIVFRATKEGITEYKTRFYDRLQQLGYRQSPAKKGILTIGYDLFEDQTEQQTLARKIDDYYPVVLSKNVHDALIRNGYKKSEFLYVPTLVLQTLNQTAAEQ